MSGTSEHEKEHRTGIRHVVSTETIGQAQHVTEETAQKLLHALEGSQPVQRLRASQIASALLGAIGFALFVAGVGHAAEDLPFLANAYGSMIVGLVLLAATGLLIRRLSGPE